jgi:hypothetical protein
MNVLMFVDSKGEEGTACVGASTSGGTDHFTLFSLTCCCCVVRMRGSGNPGSLVAKGLTNFSASPRQ